MKHISTVSRRRMVLVFGAFALWTAAAFAAVPQLINFQGVLKDGSGNPVANGSYSVTFTIYDAATGGTNLWAETRTVNTTNGLFAVLLGASNPVPDSVFNRSNRWLGIAVSPDAEMSPRQQLVSVGYAYRVHSVDSALGGNILTKVSIGPGHTNTGTDAFVAGANNTASGFRATVGGGSQNRARGDFSTVAGGGGGPASDSNSAGGAWSTVGGGSSNAASGDNATVGGGFANTASGDGATAPGGYNNTASGTLSFAAGQRAKAIHDGAFVWADFSIADFSSNANNQFNVRAVGGTRIFSNAILSAGVILNAGASAWVAASDSNLKRNIRVLDGKEMLEKVLQLPIKRWSYKAQDPSIEHIGPMAQDFYPLFQVGDDEKTISTIDPPGIALAAIQGLYQIVQELKAENEELKDRILKLEKNNPQAQVENQIPKEKE